MQMSRGFDIYIAIDGQTRSLPAELTLRRLDPVKMDQKIDFVPESIWRAWHWSPTSGTVV